MKNNIKKILREQVENYMFFQNLKTIKKHVDMLLSKSPEDLDKILKKHDWASDHISSSKNDIEDVCNFFTNGYVSESNDETIKCSGCGWSWKSSESSVDDLYNCHECGKDNTPKMVESKGPCWKGYKQIGMKNKGGKDVPNCVPIEEEINVGLNESSGDCENRKLNTPWYTPDGPKKRSVCVKNDKDNVVKVNFGDPNMKIKKSDPERRKSFRARHNCDNPGPKWKARYWSCKAW